ncbi:MAG TPA: hypothetical protein VFF24_07520 [Acidimicrobiia bacterium]|nr:hypothetical protein [Acidimicrobiia bacterium]
MRSLRPGSSRPTVVVAGALAQRPGIGGHAWVFRNWLAGFAAAGADVLFVDRLEPAMLDDPDALPETTVQWRWLAGVMAGAGMDGRYAVLFDGGRRCLGLDRADLERRARGAVLFNVMGYLDDETLLAAAARRVFVDIDPGFPQLWRELGLHDAFAGHDAFVTVGQNVGRAGCTVPTGGIEWIPTLPPVDLAAWPIGAAPAGREAGRLTSICTWRGPFGPVVHDGVTYGLRVHEFRRFAALPGMVPGARFELALDIDDDDAADRALLAAQGWRLRDPRRVAGNPRAYQAYVAGSSAEFLVAKQLYVRTGGGWVSDRSACYLASGRPVIAQDTGLAGGHPLAESIGGGEGFVTFTTPGEAAAAVAEVLGNPARHAKAARELAVDCFDAAKVARSLLHRLGVA